MTVYVFTGPTLSPTEACGVLDAVYLPPVSQGDVYRVALKQPQAIGIIDGYFERVPAVWHKEILWAMAQGIHVYGSASVGALRAAELAPFGMEGVGWIFEAYRDGIFEDDDEVAVAHGAAETGYLPGSEAMVNIRRTLEHAEATGVISPATRGALVRIGKHLFYPERSYPLILRRAVEQGVPGPELRALHGWLPRGRINQKRADACTMLRVMRARLTAGLELKRVQYSFERTEMWEQARCLAGELYLDGDTRADTILLDTLIDELRLAGHAYTQARRGALWRSLALEESRRQGMVVTAQALRETTAAFCQAYRLLDPEALRRWLEENHLTPDQFMRLMEEEARLRWVETLAQQEAMRHLPDYLRVTGAYASLLARARDKQQALASRGLQDPSLMDTGLTEDELLCWYFEEHLGCSSQTDMTHYARDVGFESEDALRRALLREYCYRLCQSRREGFQT